MSLIKSKIGLINTSTGVVFYNSKELPYTLITNKKLKNFYIEVSLQKGVIVKNPGYSEEKVQKLLDSKAAWIFSKLHLVQNRFCIANIYENENKILLLGKKESLHVKNLEKFYQEKTKEIVSELVNQYAQKMNLFPDKIGFRKAKRRWGSCSGSNALSFNTSLAQLPIECIIYVVIHELAHIRHKHHQKSFWFLVKEFCPTYKQIEKEIKNYSPSIY